MKRRLWQAVFVVVAWLAARRRFCAVWGACLSLSCLSCQNGRDITLAPVEHGLVQAVPIETPPEDDETFILYVSNQSMGRPEVDIEVFIDDKLLVRDLFPVNDGHTRKEYHLRLPLGTHDITARSSEGQARFSTTLRLDKRTWALLSYYYSSDKKGGTPIEPGFALDRRDEPIRIQ